MATIGLIENSGISWGTRFSSTIVWHAISKVFKCFFDIARGIGKTIPGRFGYRASTPYFSKHFKTATFIFRESRSVAVAQSI